MDHYLPPGGGALTAKSLVKTSVIRQASMTLVVTPIEKPHDRPGQCQAH